MLLVIRPMCRKYRLLESVDIPVTNVELAQRLEKNGGISMKAGTYVLPRGTVINIMRWKEDSFYCETTINIRIKDNEGNPWAGSGRFFDLSILKDIVFDVEEVS